MQCIKYTLFAATSRLVLFRETVAVYCENHTEHTDTVRTSQETHYVSTTEINRLMLFRETVAVSCENHTEHTDTVRTSQETHYVSSTEINRSMLLRVQALCTEKDEQNDLEVVVRDTTMVGGQGSNIFGFEGSQAVSVSPYGRSEACVQD
jgi:hypothetical protein